MCPRHKSAAQRQAGSLRSAAQGRAGGDSCTRRRSVQVRAFGEQLGQQAMRRGQTVCHGTAALVAALCRCGCRPSEPESAVAEVPGADLAPSARASADVTAVIVAVTVAVTRSSFAWGSVRRCIRVR